jgi:hypothetical protein
MKLAELAQVAEIIAAVAVVVSLVYVGIEVRSNTSAVRGAAMQAIATTDADALMTIAADADLSEIIRIGHLNPSQFNEAEAFRYHTFMRQFWLSFQNIYQQSELGLIDPSVWRSYLSVICGMWSHTGVRETWPEHAEILETGFISEVQGCKAE